MAKMTRTTELRILKWYAEFAMPFVGFASWNPRLQLLTAKTPVNATFRRWGFILLHGYWIPLSIGRVTVAFAVPALGSQAQFGVSFRVLYVFICVCYEGCFVLNIGSEIPRRDILYLFNELFKRYKRLPAYRRAGRLYVYAQYLLGAASTVSATAIILIEVHYAWIVTRQGSVWFTLVAPLLALLFATKTMLQFGVLTTYVLMYFRIAASVLDESEGATESKDEDDGEEGKVQQLARSLHEYRTLALLCNFFNATYCRFVVPGLKFLISISVMLCIVIPLRLGFDESPGLSIIIHGFLVTAVYLGAALIVAANMMSTFWEKSVRFIHNIRRELVQVGHGHRSGLGPRPRGREELLLSRAYTRSLKPLRFAVGNFYYMEREAKLTLASFLVSGTGNMLIVFKP